MRAEHRTSWVVTLWSIFGVAFAGGGSVVLFMLAATRGGTAMGVGAIAALFVLPIALALAVRRWRVAVHGTFVLGLAVLIIAARWFPEETRAAFDGNTASTAAPVASGLGPNDAAVSRSPEATTSAPEPESTDFRFGSASYVEDDCPPLEELSALATAHVPGGTRATAEALARARYPIGLPFIQAQTDAMLAAWYTKAPDSLEGVASRFDVAVHEGSHIWVSKRFDPATVTYPVRTDLSIVTKRLHNFDRSAIVSRHVDAATDPYAKIYLSGASGAQGFNTLLDEYNAYTHTLAARLCTRDLLASGTRVSARDGILTMMYYVETYLAIAREEHAADYAAILADPGHRRLILTIWDRAELWLRRSAEFGSLGIDDARIKTWVYDPTRLAELTRVRDAEARDH